jgi:alpha-tubulin suppressor-like RCC1 family protein
MKSRIISVILSVFLFSQVSFAQLCAKLVDVRAGEDHILALSEDGFLFSCGGGDGEMIMSLAPAPVAGVSSDLMLSTAAESLAKMPQRLAEKSRKFYCLTPATTISARQKELESLKAADTVNVKELLQWLDEVWLNGDLEDSITEDEYLEFRKAVELSQ